MYNLESLLTEYYDNPVLSRQCRDVTLEYIRTHETLEGKDVIFIKKLTKIASHILRSDPIEVDTLLERVYQYNLEGVDRIRKGGANHLKEERRQKLETHLISHSSTWAEKLFVKTNDAAWAQKWYAGCDEAAKRSESTEPMYSAHQYSHAGRAARALHVRTQNIDWAVRWYVKKRKAADIAALHEAPFAAKQYSYAAQTAQYLFEKTESLNWAAHWYHCSRKSADLSYGTERTASAEAYSLAGGIAKKMFSTTGDKEWARRASDCYAKFLELTKESRGTTRRLRGMREKVSSEYDHMAYESREE